MITIHSNDVLIEELNLTYTNDESESPAILMNGDDNTLNKVHIKTNSYGIQLDDAHHNELSHISITGDNEIPLNSRKHGIDIWKSNFNEIHESHMEHVKDGIYIESSDENNIYHNTASHSRYGYHLMFTKNTQLEKNESYENVSGMMIMGTKGTIANNNTLTYNQTNVQSLGLLLFDVNDATITNNDITNNRVGIFVEDASDNDISMNNIQSNYIGLEFKRAENNVIFNNSFTANIVQGQANESSNNKTNNNYWGDHFGLDLTGDKKSDLMYKVTPFFLNVTNEFPPFQLLFHSPGMIFLEQLLHTPIDQQLIDQSPLLESPLDSDKTEKGSSVPTFLFSIILLLVSTIIILMGVKK